MKLSAILIAAAALGATAPAFAAQPSDADRVKITYDAKHDKYCVSQELTGEFLAAKDCRTKEAWAKAGLKIGDQSDPAKLASK